MAQSTDRKRLLLIDDDEDDYLILKDVTEAYFPSVRVTYLPNCDKLDKTIFKGIDIVLLDINMPRVSGFECLDLIRKAYSLTRLPVIMYSNSFATRDVETAYRKGANLFANKPATFQNIKKLVETVVSMDWTNIDAITRQNSRSNNILKY